MVLSATSRHKEQFPKLVVNQGGRMTYTMETDESAHPVDIRLIGSYAAMQMAHALTQLVQNVGRTQRR